MERALRAGRDPQVTIERGALPLDQALKFAKKIADALESKRLAAFLAGDANGEKLPTHLTFPLNFIDELRRKAPGGASR